MVISGTKLQQCREYGTRKKLETERAGSGLDPYLDSFKYGLLIEGTRSLPVPYLNSNKL